MNHQQGENTMEKERIAELRKAYAGGCRTDAIGEEVFDALEAAQASLAYKQTMLDGCESEIRHREEIDKVQRTKITMLENQLREAQAELATAREVIEESMEARRTSEAEGGALNQLNNEIDRLRADLSAAREPIREMGVAVVLEEEIVEAWTLSDLSEREISNTFRDENIYRPSEDHVFGARLAWKFAQSWKKYQRWKRYGGDRDNPPFFRALPSSRVAGEVPDRAAWLTVEEMANALVMEFGTPLSAARGFAKAIAEASKAKALRATKGAG